MANVIAPQGLAVAELLGAFDLAGSAVAAVDRLTGARADCLTMVVVAAADNYIRYGMRIGAVCLPFLMGGLNDHMPGDYTQSIINSDPAAWQPFK